MNRSLALAAAAALAREERVHRAVGGTDVYFVVNPQHQDVMVSAAFRISGKVPELWWPDTGRIEKMAVYREKATLA